MLDKWPEGQQLSLLSTQPSVNYNGPQIKFINQTFRKKIKILSKAVDGKILLMNADVFVGSGGTMTAESALLGVPTISYNAVPNLIESYLVQKKLVKRETNPRLIAHSIKKFIENPNVKNKQRAKKEFRNVWKFYKLNIAILVLPTIIFIIFFVISLPGLSSM